MAEAYPQQTSRFTTRQFRMHLIVVMFVTPGCFSTVERRGKACQQMCYTGLQHQHRDRGTDRDNTPEHVCSSTARPQYPPDRRDAVKVLYNNKAQTLRSASRCNFLRLHETTSVADVVYKTYDWNANIYMYIYIYRHSIITRCNSGVYTQSMLTIY